MLLGVSFEPTSTSGLTGVPKDPVPSSLRRPRMQSRLSVSVIYNVCSVLCSNQYKPTSDMYNGYEWYGRTLEVRQVSIFLVIFLKLHTDMSSALFCLGSVRWLDWS